MAGSPPAERPRPRSRSRSPRRKEKSGGFRWKEKRSDTSSYNDDSRDRSGLERGYRNRSPRRDNRNRDSDDRPRYRDDDRDDRDSRDKRDRDSDRTSAPRRDMDSSTKATAPKPPAPPAGGGEEMIIVTVNDRLGTKAQIPCFASDKIKDLRVLVGARVGRKPHEILLKRQGERPFKDQLSLADYEVHNGAQLDLEVDTGD
ncbi:hypothetical protein DL546_006126 [Coniochaeta pulveracea]|uniref:Ubiquitin-like modifier HUB1 n=1 Tax=Coniochaeta pulveracea TaxID=177199 RepID=A0A420Y7P7_9PEZI|nr:hypothetical protein DL546_006126 [Coniochaeta pulveracea]